jgi:hypothetical protein
MPYIDAVIFTKWVKDADDTNVPDAVSDIYAWAIANDEYLPEGESGKGPFGRYEDITGQANVHQRILDGLAVFAAKLEITVATAQQFASDNRFWTLGYRRYDDDGEILASNWDDVLTGQERQQAVNYITNNSNITAQRLGNRFDATDTRLEIAQKLKEFFRE